jgi:hypothetical protein
MVVAVRTSVGPVPMMRTIAIGVAVGARLGYRGYRRVNRCRPAAVMRIMVGALTVARAALTVVSSVAVPARLPPSMIASAAFVPIAVATLVMPMIASMIRIVSPRRLLPQSSNFRVGAVWEIVSDPDAPAAADGGADGKTGLQKIAVCRCLPVQHFAGGKDAGSPPQHKVGIDFIKGNAARG